MLWHKYNYLSIVWGLSELTVSWTDSCGHFFFAENHSENQQHLTLTQSGQFQDIPEFFIILQ